RQLTAPQPSALNLQLQRRQRQGPPTPPLRLSRYCWLIPGRSRPPTLPSACPKWPSAFSSTTLRRKRRSATRQPSSSSRPSPLVPLSLLSSPPSSLLFSPPLS